MIAKCIAFPCLVLVLLLGACSNADRPNDETEPLSKKQDGVAAPDERSPPPSEPIPSDLGPSAFLIHRNAKVRHSIDPQHVLKAVAAANPRDAIPPIYNPQYTTAGKVKHLADHEKVIGVVLNSQAHAYPIKILDRHEIVNDVIGKIPIAVTYCPLCGSALAFNRTIEGRTYTFGVSGYLYQSDLLMWDRETESFWSQITGTAVVGPMTDARLEMIVASVTTWGRWRAEHADSKVLVGPYTAGRYARYPYGNYEQSDRLLFPVLNNDSRYHRKAIVTGIRVGDQTKAYLHGVLKKMPPVFEDVVGGQKLTVRYHGESDTCQIFDVQGNELPVLRAFWFAWHTFHPNTRVFEEPKEADSDA